MCPTSEGPPSHALLGLAHTLAGVVSGGKRVTSRKPAFILKTKQLDILLIYSLVRDSMEYLSFVTDF